MLEQLKQKIKAALARFAKRKATEQAEGMATEARGIVASTQALARRNPGGFAMLVLLGAGLLYLWQRPRRALTQWFQPLCKAGPPSPSGIHHRIAM